MDPIIDNNKIKEINISKIEYDVYIILPILLISVTSIKDLSQLLLVTNFNSSELKKYSFFSIFKLLISNLLGKSCPII